MAELADFTNKMQARQRARALHRGLAAFLCGEARGSFMGDEAVRMFGAFERSTPTIENVVKTVYFEALQLKLDEALLGTAAGTAVQSAGLRNGIKLARRIGRRRSAFEDAGGRQDGSERRCDCRQQLRNHSGRKSEPSRDATRLARSCPYTVYGPSAVADGDLIAVATNSIASAVNNVPRFEVSREATLHMEDTTPLALSASGTPNVPAAPSRSLFQTDSVGAKIILEASWIRRSDSGVAWVTNATGW